MNNPQQISQVIEVKYGTGEHNCYAYVIAYINAPTFSLEMADGTQFTWRCDLCKSTSAENQILYWKNRAKIAEDKLNERL